MATLSSPLAAPVTQTDSMLLLVLLCETNRGGRKKNQYCRAESLVLLCWASYSRTLPERLVVDSSIR